MSDLIEFSAEVRLGNEKLVRVTSDAAQKLVQLMDREGSGDFLRIRITGGGCNGLSYKMKFVAQGKAGDIGVMSEGIGLLVDSLTKIASSILTTPKAST